MITNEQLIASGAIDPTKPRRKSLGGKVERKDERQLDLFSDDDDADDADTKQPPADDDPE